LPCFEPEPLNACDSIEAVVEATLDEEPLKAYFLQQLFVPSPSSTYLKHAAREGGGLDIKDHVFKPHLTQNTGARLWFPCYPEELCDRDGNNCAGIHLTVGHAAAAATTAKSLRIPLIVVVPLTPTPSKLDAHIWH
jgi:hypothetical protein